MALIPSTPEALPSRVSEQSQSSSLETLPSTNLEALSFPVVPLPEPSPPTHATSPKSVPAPSFPVDTPRHSDSPDADLFANDYELYARPPSKNSKYNEEQIRRLNHLTFVLGCCDGRNRHEWAIEEVWMVIPETRGGGAGTKLTFAQIIQYIRIHASSIPDKHLRMAKFFKWVEKQPESQKPWLSQRDLAEYHKLTSPHVHSRERTVSRKRSSANFAAAEDTAIESQDSGSEIGNTVVVNPSAATRIEASDSTPIAPARITRTRTKCAVTPNGGRSLQPTPPVHLSQPKRSRKGEASPSPANTFGQRMSPAAAAAAAAEISSVVAEPARSVRSDLGSPLSYLGHTPKPKQSSNPANYEKVFHLTVRSTIDPIRHLANTPGLIGVSVENKDEHTKLYSILVKGLEVTEYLMRTPGFTGVRIGPCDGCWTCHPAALQH